MSLPPSCYLGDHRIIMQPSFGGKLIIPSTGLSIMPDLILSGHIEAELCNWIRNNIQPGNLCIDVGANIGFITLLLGIMKAKVYSLEANPTAFDFLNDNVKMNGLDAKIFNVAVWSEETQLILHSSSRILGGSSVKEAGRCQSDNLDVVVPALKLDDFCSEEGIDYIDFLKIDIEGAEYHAFLGMIELLHYRKIGTIIFEFSRWMLGEDLNLLKEFLLSAQEARYFSLGPHGEEQPLDLETQFQSGPNQNILMRL